jgi:SAM-dependent methyltransferase
MKEELFDQASEYDAMLNRGLRLSGEDKTYFIEGRLARLASLLPPGTEPKRILDFGCGTGDTSRLLLQHFPGAEIVGVDVSTGAIEHARSEHGRLGISFLATADVEGDATFDLCYCNGAFHHIEPADRAGTARDLLRLLRPGGYLALFENNAWHPGTRLVMSRIPFDRGAKPVPPPSARRLVVENGFTLAGPTRYLFVFPAVLKALRFTERRLERLPVGAQYLVLGQRPEG